jgi:hypothetical protein
MTREEKELVLASIDGSLPVGGEERVRELLKRDPAALEFYALEALVHGELEWHFSVRRGFQGALQRSAEVVVELRRRQIWRMATTSLGIAAAALVILAAVAFLRHVPPPTVAFRFNEGAVSRVVRASGNSSDAALGAGDRLTLEHGAAELNFPTGVRAVIEAPAELVYGGENGVKIERGTAYFHIERPEASGFTVTLPQSEVVDLGTRFGIIAPAGEPAQIHLIDGRILTQRRTGDFEPAAELRPGQALQEDDTAATGFASVPFNKDWFARQLPDPYEHVAIDFDRVGDDTFKPSGPDRARVREVIVRGGRIRQVAGRTGNAVRFDGSGSHLEIRGWSEYHHRPSGTLSFWVRVPKGPRPRECPLSWGVTERVDEGRWSVAIDAHERHAELAIRSGVATSSHLSAASRLAHDTWHHLAFVFKREVNGKTEVRVFVDGREDPQTAFLPMASGPDPDTALIIGTHIDPALWTSHAFSGDIDDLRVYRTALDARQIAALARGNDPSKAE